jgi:hypothetical protein
MTTSTQLGIYHVLLVLYVLAVVFLNLLAFLISDFYRKKFNQPSPRVGFVAAIAMGLAIVGVSLFRRADAVAVEFIITLLFTASGLVSLLSSIGLYITMSKVRK